MNKTLVKLIWSLVAIVLLAGVMRLVMVDNGSQSDDQRVVIKKSK